MFGSGKKGTPDNEPTLKTLAGRQVPVEQGSRGRRHRGAGDRRLSQVPRHRAARRRSAPRRCAASATSRWTAPTTRAPTGSERARLQGGDRPLQRLPQDLSERPEQRPRPLPAGPGLRAGRRPEHGAEDARPAGQGLSAQPLPRRGPVPPRRAAVHRQGLSERREGVRHRAGAAARPSRTTTARSTCRAGRSSSRAGSRTRLRSFFAVLDLKIAGKKGEGGIETLAGLTRADRELVEDTFRVTSISLANLKGAESDPDVHRRLAGAAELRVPRLRAARRALHPPGADQGRGRHLRPVRPQSGRCMRRRRCCRRG